MLVCSLIIRPCIESVDLIRNLIDQANQHRKMTKDDDTTPAKKASQPLREISEPGQNQKICERSCTFSTPGAAGRLSLNMPTSDMVRGSTCNASEPECLSTCVALALIESCFAGCLQSPASRRDLIHKTNEQIVRALNRRQVTGEQFETPRWVPRFALFHLSRHLWFLVAD